LAFLAWGILKNSMGGRQIVLVSTAGFSVFNTGIFWREAKTKRLFSQCMPVIFPTSIALHGSLHICGFARTVHLSSCLQVSLPVNLLVCLPVLASLYLPVGVHSCLNGLVGLYILFYVF
jgi:hypothetical protein